MEKRFFDQKVRARNFEARNGGIETGVLIKTREGQHVSVEWKQEECYQQKAKGQGTTTRALCVTKRISVEKQHSRPLLLQNRRRKKNGKSSWKGKSPRGRSFLGKGGRRPCRDYLGGNLHESVM